MSNTNLSTLSMSELKAIALELDCTLKGDKRAKQSWIDAIELAQHLETLIEPENETEAEWEVRASKCIGLGECLDEIINGSDDDDTWELVDYPTTAAPAATKKGATSVFASLLCLVIFAFATICNLLVVAIKVACYFAALFGKHDPDLDLYYQLVTRPRQELQLATC